MSIEIRIIEKRSRLITSTNPYSQQEHMGGASLVDTSETVADIVHQVIASLPFRCEYDTFPGGRDYAAHSLFHGGCQGHG